MSIAKKIDEYITQSSWIRRMFEAGLEMKRQHGPGNVFDFSIGNPNVPPPAEVRKAVMGIMSDDIPNKHGYMPNSGYTETREILAGQLRDLYGVAGITASNIVMTCGAGGALNTILKTLLDPGDEVIIIAPFFVEYKFYIANFQATARVVQSNEDFSLDLSSIAAAIGERTKAIIINSPNNPSGRIYSAASLLSLSELLREKGEQQRRVIYLVSDEPYREILYDGAVLPSVLSLYENSIVAYSYSKSLSVPGERIGYALVNPHAKFADKLIDGLIFSNRILGFVNAPALWQRVVAIIDKTRINVEEYQRKRDLLCDVLNSAGYKFIKPEGAFYLFPKSPIADDVDFVRILQSKRILGVPGSGFGRAGYFRLAYCVEDETIANSAASFKAALEECR